jgi:asparagine synthase (glutamine-hydrolysing)
MCRIAGIINKGGDGLRQSVQLMTNAMAHGGPDDDGLFVDEELNVGLGHRRLSIIDLSPLGHQPMIEDDMQLYISFNGEIYNYVQLRNELIGMGYTFRSHSDTEVLLKGYHAWGVEMLPKLKGMFAFLLLDKKKAQVIAARDHAGIKPLYYGFRGDEVYFSSEVRGILAANPNWKTDEDWPVRFLTFGFIPEPYSTLQNVFHLPKGSYMLYDLKNKSYEINPFISFPFSSLITTSTEAIEKTRTAVLDSVERHLVADVPVGIFLSGGIDSSILTFACRKFNKGQIKTLSIYFDDEKYSEKYYQDLVIEKTGVSHQSFLVSQDDFETSLPDVFKAMDQPSIDGINTYFITRYAKEYGLKVVLSGLGADELFGGYPSFQNPTYNRVKKMRLAAKVASLFLNNYPAKKLSYLHKGDALEEYLFSRGVFVPSDVSNLLNVSKEKVWDVIGQEQYNQWTNLLPGNRVSMLEQNVYMQNQLLRDSDIYSMWHSIELRVPFLDVDVIKLAHSIAPEIKFTPQKKDILIKAFIDELPEAVWNRKKMGFTFPFQNWFKESSYLKQAEQNLPQLAPARSGFDKGSLTWSRYWTQLVSAKFANSNGSTAVKQTA